MGVISKYERGPALGANYGVIVPSGIPIDDDHRAVLVVDESDLRGHGPDKYEEDQD
jgi:hypothetical protein